MSVSYSGVHSITFFKDDDNSFKNSWGDFHMVPTSRPYITPPPAQIKMVSLPRSNKILDLTNALTRDVIYDAREGDWEFYIDHDQWEDWTKAFDEISEYLDGSVFHVVLADEPLYSYKGRVYVSDYSPEPNYSKFRVHYSLDAICEVYEYEPKVIENSSVLSSVITIGDTKYYCGTQLFIINDFADKNYLYVEVIGVYSDKPCYILARLSYDGVNTEYVAMEIHNLYGMYIPVSSGDDVFLGPFKYSGIIEIPEGYSVSFPLECYFAIKREDKYLGLRYKLNAGVYIKQDEIVI